jgi:hypothetical protein
LARFISGYHLRLLVAARFVRALLHPGAPKQVLIDFARGQETDKRGRRAPHIGLSGIEDMAGEAGPPLDFLDLDAALGELVARNSSTTRLISDARAAGLPMPDHGLRISLRPQDGLVTRLQTEPA